MLSRLRNEFGCKELNISKSIMYRFMYDYDEKIPFIKMKRKILFNKVKVLEWLEGRELVNLFKIKKVNRPLVEL